MILAMFHAKKGGAPDSLTFWRLLPVIGPFIPQKKLLTTSDLANMLQQNAFAVASVPDFPQNCAKPCGFSG
jgi:hypothetical protein